MIEATLPSKQKLTVLIDSGASTSILSEATTRQSAYLSSLPVECVQPRKIKIANGAVIVTDKMINFKVSVNGHEIGISAYLVPTMGLIPCLLGNNDLERLKAVLDFEKHTLRFRKPRNTVMRATRNITLKPGQTRYLTLSGRMPVALKSGEAVLNSSQFGSKFMPKRLIITITKGTCTVPLKNLSNKQVNIKTNVALAYLDFPLSLNGCISFTDNEPNTDRDKLYKEKRNTFSFLDKDDDRLKMTDVEILKRDIDLDSPDCVLNEDEKVDLMKVLHENKSAFSLHGEIGNCEHEVDFDLKDKSPFYIRPYNASEKDKIVIDRELDRLVKLGVLKKGLASCSSPIMVVDKRGQDASKRVVCDLRHLNSRMYRQIWPFPLVRDTMQKVGNSRCTVMSIIDLRDAFHSLKLSKNSQKYSGVASYYGGRSYYYVRLPQGASISPAKFQEFVDSVLADIPNSKEFLVAHTDDVLVFSRDKKAHKRHIELLLQALRKHGLKISPKKAKFFRQRVDYMGHVLSIRDKRPHIQAMQSKCDAIRRLKRPSNVRELRKFIGAVNFLSMYLPRLHTLLKPMYNLTRKPKQTFHWLETHQENFEKIKELLVKPPVLVLPSASGKLTLYSDTSRVATGASLWQTQDGVDRLIGYHSKSLPPAAQRYGISELELTGLYINIESFKHILKSTHFQAVVDHSALVTILKSKKEPPTLRMRKLIEKLSDYSFETAYQKGSSLVICDLLSRMCLPAEEDDFKVTPVACSGLNVIQTVDDTANATCRENEVQDTACTGDEALGRRVTRSMAKEQNINLAPQQDMQHKRKRRIKTPLADSQPTTNNVPTNTADEQNIVQPPPPQLRPATELETLNQNTEAPLQGGSRTLVGSQLRTLGERDGLEVPLSTVIPRAVGLSKDPENCQEMLIPPQEKLFQPPTPLFEDLSPSQVMCRHVPRQKEINKLLNVIRTKCLRDFAIPLKAKEIKYEQQRSPYFRAIYEYLASGTLPSKSRSARSVMKQSEQFLLIQGILFKIDLDKDMCDCKLTLCIPESQAPYILSLYHDSLLSSHQGINKTYVTIRRKFFIPQLYDKLAAFIKSCYICQQRKIPTKAEVGKPFQPRIFSEYRPFEEIHMDIKSMFPSHESYCHLLVCVCSQTRYVIAVPLRRIDAVSVAEAIIQRVVLVFGVPKKLVFDEGKAFANAVLQNILKTLKIDSTYISPYNHGSLLAERSIQSVSNLLISHLSGNGKNWPAFVAAVTYAYNTFSHSLLGGYSPYELAFIRPTPDLLNVNLNAQNVPVSHKDYMERLQSRFHKIGQVFLDLQAHNQNKQATKQVQDIKRVSTFSEGQLVYFLMPGAADLDTNTKSFKISYVGPLRIHEVLDATHCILSDMQGRLLHGVHHVKRLKPAFIRSKDGPVSNIQQLRNCFNKNKGQTGEETSAAVIQITDDAGYEISYLANDHFIYKTPSKTTTADKHQSAQKSCIESDTFVSCESRDSDLGVYLTHTTANHNIAVKESLDDRKQSALLKHLEKLPPDGSRMRITKARLKDGQVELLFSAETENMTRPYSVWIREGLHPCLDDRIHYFGSHVAVDGMDHKLRISGSMNYFLRSLVL